jgi:hypothetical protein
MFSQVMHIVSALREYFKSSFLKSPKLEGSFLFPKIKQFLYKQKQADSTKVGLKNIYFKQVKS